MLVVADVYVSYFAKFHQQENSILLSIDRFCYTLVVSVFRVV